MSRQKKIIKIRGEINKIEHEKKIEKIYQTKNWFFEKIFKDGQTLSYTIEGKKRKDPNQQNYK